MVNLFQDGMGGKKAHSGKSHQTNCSGINNGGHVHFGLVFLYL